MCRQLFSQKLYIMTKNNSENDDENDDDDDNDDDDPFGI